MQQRIDWDVLLPRLGRILYVMLERLDPTDVPTDTNGDADWNALSPSVKAVYCRCASAMMKEFEDYSNIPR